MKFSKDGMLMVDYIITLLSMKVSQKMALLNYDMLILEISKK